MPEHDNETVTNTVASMRSGTLRAIRDVARGDYAVAVCVLAPAYNEATAIVPLLDRIEECRGADQAVVVDDGSTDGTGDLVDAWQGALPHTVLRHPRNRGLGAAMATGIRWAAITMGTPMVVPMGGGPRVRSGRVAFAAGCRWSRCGCDRP